MTRRASLAGIAVAIAAVLAPFTGRGAVYVNSDVWNFFTDNDLESMDRAALAAAVDADVDFYVAAGASAVLYNLNAQRALFDSKVFAPAWKDLSLGEDGRLRLRGKALVCDRDEAGLLKVARGARRLAEVLPDFMARRYARCHARGVEMWHSMRMNDVHFTYLGNEWSPLHADLWLDRKDLLRAWYRHAWRGEWADNGFDYARKEVYDIHLALVREYLLEHESDGIELDWMRALPVFAPGFDETHAPVLTRFMRETRQIADAAAAKWGHRVKIGVRVPARVHDTYRMGIDLAVWAREGLVDLVVPSPKNTSTEMDCDVAIYRALCPRPVVLAPCLDYDCCSEAAHHVLFNEEIDLGFVSGWYGEGADAAYLYNHFPRMLKEGVHKGYPAYLARLGDRTAVAKSARRHVFTRHEPVGEGSFALSPYWNAVWAGCCNGSVKVNCGEGTSGRRSVVVVGAKTKLDVDVRVNTVECPVAGIDEAVRPSLPAAAPGEELCFISAQIPPGVLHDGWNGIELFNRGKRDLAAGDFVWLEVSIE